MPRSPGYRSISTADYSQCWTPPPDWSTGKVGASTSHTPLLWEFHWLRSRERVDFKLAVFIFRCLHGLSPRYLSDDTRRVADSNRRRLRSSSSALLTVRPTRLVTMGDRAFPPVAGSRLWNSLPHEVTSASTLSVLTYLFQLSFPTN